MILVFISNFKSRRYHNLQDKKRKDSNFFRDIENDSEFDIFINPYREKSKKFNISDLILSKNEKINSFFISVINLFLKPQFKVFYFTICAIAFAVLLLVAFNTNKEYTGQRNLLQENFANYTVAVEKLEAKNQELYSQRILGSFTQPQLVRMKEKFNRYALLINNNHIKENTYTFESKTDKIVITFYERFERDSFFPFPGDLVHSISMINEETIENLIRIYTNEAEYSFRTELAEDGRKVHVDFNNVNPGEIITLDIAFDFAKKLGLDDGSLEIFYARTN